MGLDQNAYKVKSSYAPTTKTRNRQNYRNLLLAQTQCFTGMDGRTLVRKDWKNTD